MKHTHHRRSDCPINFALEIFGDPWSLLLIRADKRKEEYILTEKGLDLIPVLVEMANWSAQHDPHTAAPAAWISLMKAEREQMIQRMRETVQSGGSVFVGEKSLLARSV